jgi:hypothetical protein
MRPPHQLVPELGKYAVVYGLLQDGQGLLLYRGFPSLDRFMTVPEDKTPPFCPGGSEAVGLIAGRSAGPAPICGSPIRPTSAIGEATSS